MAMVIHSSSSSSTLHLDEIFRRSSRPPYLTGTIHASSAHHHHHHQHHQHHHQQQQQHHHGLKGKNFVFSSSRSSSRNYKLLFTSASVAAAARSHILTRSIKPFYSLNLSNESDETGEFDQSSRNEEVVVVVEQERNVAHQKMATIRYPLMAFSVANALMLTLPLEAMAATCEADSSLLNMPILLSVALIGATVGGLLARQRRGELERLNDQLRQINAALRRQAKIESYAPTLSYAPVGSRIAENEVIVDPRKQELISRLRTGKNFLRNQDPEKAFVEFKAALELAQNMKDPVEEKKAARGLGASLQRQKKYRDAIKYHSMVLSISERIREDSGDTEAIGAIADCYTELGDLERAGIFYDKYIARLERD